MDIIVIEYKMILTQIQNVTRLGDIHKKADNTKISLFNVLYDNSI